MEQDKDLEKFFAKMNVPEPDSERRKATLNLSVAAFEAQKSAVSQKNEKNRQGTGWLARLTSQIQPERKDDMHTSNKKYIYGGLIGGGLATACFALMIYQPANRIDNFTVGQAEVASLDAAPQELAQAQLPEAPGSSEVSATMQQAIEDKNAPNIEGALRSGGSAVPVPLDAAKTQALAMAEPQMAAPMPAEKARRAASADMAESGFAPAPAANYITPMPSPVMEAEGRDKFEHFDQNTIKQVKAEPVSTFSIDVDTASYAFVRQSLDNGVLPQKDAVRVEEMVNYFDYAYPLPKDKEAPFSTNVVVKPSPWNTGKQLLTIGIKGYDVEKAAQPDSNLVFLLDTSGSMNEPKKLPLLKQSLSMLLDTLKPTDKVSIVVYAGSAGTVLQPTEVSKKGEILQALNNLAAGGSTAGGEGIRMAYDLAQANFNKNAVNRVILATDGDFNVGITEPEELKGFIEREREKGVFLSVLGFGTGNYNDVLMQELAQNGNGVAAYIDTLSEARKVLVQEASATLFPIAKDVKIQVEFNPATVSEYRLVGYETRGLNTEDFNNDKVDAGDIGAGAEVTAIYELTPVGATPAIDDSRYAPKAAVDKTPDMAELAFVKLRYKLPAETESKLITTPVAQSPEQPDAVMERETNWAVAVAGFAQLLKGGTYTGGLTYDDVLKLAEANKGDDPYGYRAEFIALIHKAKTAAAMPAQAQPSGPGEYMYR